MSHASTRSRASELLSLHHTEKLLKVVNVWDVISAKVVADVPGTAALATGRTGPWAAYYGEPLDSGVLRLRGREEHPP